MNLNEVITDSVNKTIAEKLPEMVSKKVSDMIDDTLTDIFRSYGNTAKEIKKKIEEKLDVNLQEFDLVDYNHLVSKAVAERISSLTQEEAIKPLMAMIKDTVGYTDKKEVGLSEIHEKIKELIVEQSYEDYGEIFFEVEENTQHKWITVKIGEEVKKGAQIEFIASTDRGTIFIFRHKTTWERMGEANVATMVSMQGVEKYIFRLYSAQVKIKVDEKYFDNEWSKYAD